MSRRYENVLNKGKKKMKTKKEVLEEISGIPFSELGMMMARTTEPSYANRLKYLHYLHASPEITLERVNELANNGNFLVRYWNDIKGMIDEINPSEFEEYPIVKNYFKKWCNSFLGEELLFKVGQGNIKEGMKLAKKIFLRFKLKPMEEELLQEKTLGEFYEPIDENGNSIYKDEHIKAMKDLSSLGYEGFYSFVAMNPKTNKLQWNIIYDKRFYPLSPNFSKQQVAMLISEIILKYHKGEIK